MHYVNTCRLTPPLTTPHNSTVWDCYVFILFANVCAGGIIVGSKPSDSTSQILYNVSCPTSTYGFYSCSYSEIPPEDCSNHQADTVVACYEGNQARCVHVHLEKTSLITHMYGTVYPKRA